MKTSRVQEAINILQASIEESSGTGKRVLKPEPKKSKKVSQTSKKVRKSEESGSKADLIGIIFAELSSSSFSGFDPATIPQPAKILI